MNKEFETVTTYKHLAGWNCTKWVREILDEQGNVLEYDWGSIPDRSIQPFLPGFSTKELPIPERDYPKINERGAFRTQHFLFVYKAYSNGDEEVRLHVLREYDIAQESEFWMVNPMWYSGERLEIDPFLERLEAVKRKCKNIRGCEEAEEILFELYLQLSNVYDSYC